MLLAATGLDIENKKITLKNILNTIDKKKNLDKLNEFEKKEYFEKLFKKQ